MIAYNVHYAVFLQATQILARLCGLSVELTSQLQVIQYIKHYIKAGGSG